MKPENIKNVTLNTHSKTLKIEKKNGKTNELKAVSNKQWNRLKGIFKVFAV